MDADTRYFVMRRRGEDAALKNAAHEAANCEWEVQAGQRLGLKPYTWAWAEWSRRWYAAGRPDDGSHALALARAEVPEAFA